MIVKDSVCVFVGPFVTDPLIVIGNVPAVAFEIVLIVRVTVTGWFEVGFTELDGRKLQVAPDGKFPQDRFTVSSNDPSPVTWNVTGAEVLDGLTVMLRRRRRAQVEVDDLQRKCRIIRDPVRIRSSAVQVEAVIARCIAPAFTVAVSGVPRGGGPGGFTNVGITTQVDAGIQLRFT